MTGSWQGLANQPSFHTSTMLLLTDGRVMVQEEATQHWHALTPDSSGSYANGTWSMLADMSIWRRYFASGVLMDGRVIVVGGEQSGGGQDTNGSEIYDPANDSWTPITLPPWAQVGDAASCILPDGRLMIGALSTPDCLIYDPLTDAWTAGAAKAIRSNEETWILLPDETILSVQCWDPYRSERYSASSNSWKDEGKPPVQLVDPLMHEIGPAMLLYDGRVIWFGAANEHGHGRTAIYTPPTSYIGTGTWAKGPDIPSAQNHAIVCNDCPASLMPNGKVLFAAAPYKTNDWGSPIDIFEFDPYNDTIVPAPTPPNNQMQLFWSRFMLLPTGQVLFGPSTNELQCYTPDGAPQEAWRPTISDVVEHCNGSGEYYFQLTGTQLNGLSQANTYGDDCYAATNFPLVRLRHVPTNQVYFCRTYDFSSLGVATRSRPESVRFDARHVPFGEFELFVIANGISSHSVPFCHRRPAQRSKCGCDHGCLSPCTRDCCHEDTSTDIHVAQLRAQLTSLERAVQRIGARTAAEPPVRQPKDRRTTDGTGELDSKQRAAGASPPSRRPK